MNILDPTRNFGLVGVSTGYNSSATSVVLSAGQGSVLPSPATEGAFNLVWWNSTDYNSPTLDPDSEIIRVTARTTDTLTVVRGQENTVASDKNTASKDYSMILAYTRKIRDDIENSINISEMTAKTNPVSGDMLVLADSEASNSLKKITFADLIRSDGWQEVGETWTVYNENKENADINTTTDVVTTVVKIETGTPVVWTTGAPTGLTAGTTYYAIKVSATTIKFATTLANAQAGTAIDITATGSGTRTLNILNYIKVNANVSHKHQKGDRFKLTNNSSVLYFFVLSVSDEANSVIELTGETYLTNSAITLPFSSKVFTPQGVIDPRDKYQFYARRSGTSQTTVDNTFTKVQLNTEDRDAGGNFDNTTNYRFTAPISGWFDFTGFTIGTSDGVLKRNIAWIYKNGASIARGSDISAGETGVNIFTSFAATKTYLNKGDYIELYVYQNDTNLGTGSALSGSFNGL